MILTCPNCGTQYVVKDGAIPPGGRQVRCASCKHSWHENPEGTAEPPASPDEEVLPAEQPVEEGPSEPAAQADDDDESLAEATLIEPRSGPELEERAYEEAAVDANESDAGELPSEPAQVAETAYGNAALDLSEPEQVAAAPQGDWKEPPHPEPQVDDFTPYAFPDELEPKRRSPVFSILIIVLLVIVAAAAFWFLAPPDLKARLGLAGVGTSPLALVTTHMDRQRLQSGNELLTVTGRVINPTGKEQAVPPLQAQLKTRAGKIVYSWTIAPPARSLAPGASASFNSAEVNVPPGGEELTITLGSGEG
jgi:predicted Zn finger-like uncharacterized protein